MNESAEKQKQENVKTDRESCDHVGYYLGFGMEIVTSPEGVNIITSQNCMMCGEIFVKLTTLSAKKPESKIQI